MEFRSLNLRYRILLPVGLVLALFSFGGFLTAHFIQRDHLDEMISSRIKGTRNLFTALLEVETAAMQGMAEAFSTNEDFRRAFLDGNRDKLFSAAQGIFTDYRTRYMISHFYFHLPDNRCFLRVHDPPRHSDLIDRFTIRQASASLSPSRGLELGPLGTLTLRVVLPWFIDNRLAGFLELGKEIDHIIPTLKYIQEVDLIVAIDKDFLDRELWEEGLTVMNKTGDWDDFQKHVISALTMEKLPEEMSPIMVDHDMDHSRTLFSLISDDGRFRVGAIPLMAAGGNEVGDMFVLRNLDKISYGQRAFFFFLMIAVVSLVVFYLLFSSYLENIARDIKVYQAKLEKEVKEHLGTEEQLAKKSAQLDVLLRERTSELEEAKAEVKILSGFLPICASCKSIRTEKGKWEQLESYIREHSEAEFSHSYCPKCAQKLYSEFRK